MGVRVVFVHLSNLNAKFHIDVLGAAHFDNVFTEIPE